MKLSFWQAWFTIVGIVGAFVLLIWVISECESRYGPRAIVIANIAISLSVISAISYLISAGG